MGFFIDQLIAEGITQVERVHFDTSTTTAVPAVVDEPSSPTDSAIDVARNDDDEVMRKTSARRSGRSRKGSLVIKKQPSMAADDGGFDSGFILIGY